MQGSSRRGTTTGNFQSRKLKLFVWRPRSFFRFPSRRTPWQRFLRNLGVTRVSLRRLNAAAAAGEYRSKTNDRPSKLMLTRRRGLGERGDKILRWRHSNCTHCDACRRETAECSQRRSEMRAGRLSSRFRLRAYRTVQTRPVSSRSLHHGIFPDFYFYTHSLQRPLERRPMASRTEQVSALFFVA